MTIASPPLDASDSHPKGELMLADFTSTGSDLASVHAYQAVAPFRL